MRTEHLKTPMDYVELHAGRRLRRSDLRRVFDVEVLAAAVEEELGVEVHYSVIRDWLTVYRDAAIRETCESRTESSRLAGTLWRV